MGGLSYNSTPETMTEFFGYCGEVLDARIIKNEEGQSRGFGYVDYATK